ncbi:hypothetical protein BOTBODRAFT_105620 [Botryobasidium botryosum FD-172 SS1]|uniref:Oxysterol-binding protein n=1 Tax=Botryobasidium botryosum (strain FD-172 SS1) TaxID=930990 RepID=A0A067N0Q8_BOTB1|nr:hypothetical protein BOTBODRAFT_105620 [Botryobasidium botryosum FD-172 SS1]
MMGLFNSIQGAATSARKRSSSAGESERAPEGSAPDDTSILDENEGSIIMSLISQLRIGMDLQRVTFPTFVLEPRSMLERITDFMSHPELVFGAENEANPEERFIRVLQYYLSGWHIKPKGVKKPYNPVLGEFFRCRYDYTNGTQGFYIAEQVSHHPPVSAYYYVSPANKIMICGELRPKSKFLGNSVSTTMEGENRVTLMGKPEDGEYVISMPNMYARGILFGRMVLELGDLCTAKNTRTGMTAEVDFKTKGYFSGVYNAIAGKVKRNNAEIGDLSGQWNHAIYYKDAKTGNKRVLFDVTSEDAKVAPKFVFPEEEQEPNESRRLWSKLTDAINQKDMEAATDAKNAVEDAQREEARKREESGVVHQPRFFIQRKGLWVPNFTLPTDPDAAIIAVQEWMWSGRPASGGSGSNTPPK